MTAQGEQRFVVVNADDFGLTNGINRGIIKAHEIGIVTSASLMVRYDAAREAADYARCHPEFSIGLHLDLAEWRFDSGEWRTAYQVVDTRDAAAVQAEVDRQLEIFEQLMKRAPTHLDSHQHVHQSEPVRSIMMRVAAQLDLPLRDCSSRVRYCGNFYGQTAEGDAYPAGISAAWLTQIIADLAPGWTEIGCHPGFNEALDSVYCAEREDELRALCDPKVRLAMTQHSVQLRSFGDFSETQKAPTVPPAP